MHVSSGILYNHESPRRPLSSCRARSRTRPRRSGSGSRTRVQLGDLDACRDWGYAGDYVRAMWLMLQQDEPGDYVIATGVLHSVRRSRRARVRAASASTGGSTCASTSRCAAARPSSTTSSATPPRRASGSAGSRTVGFEQLVDLLVDADLQRLSTVTPARETA